MPATPTDAALIFEQMIATLKERGAEMEVMRSIKTALDDSVTLLEGTPKGADLARLFGEALANIRLPEPKVEMKGATADDLAEALTVALVRGLAQVKLPAAPPTQLTVQPIPVTLQEPVDSGATYDIEITERDPRTREIKRMRMTKN